MQTNANLSTLLLSSSSAPSLSPSSNPSRRHQRTRTHRCHGNRKLRRFRHKCRRRGLSEVEIQQLINNDRRPLLPVSTFSGNRSNETRQTRNTTSKKRKRMATSASSRSISQRLPKRQKEHHPPVLDPVVTERKMEHVPKYMTKTPDLLFQMLRAHLHHPLKRKEEQIFIYRRLYLFDRQYRLDHHRNLWQSYHQWGSQHEIWPEYIHRKAKTTEHHRCLQLVNEHLLSLNQQYDQCTKDLVEQPHPSSSSSSWIQYDEKLKDFVQVQQKYWSLRMQSHRNRYQSFIQEQNLYHNLLSDALKDDEKEQIKELLKCKDQQWQMFQTLSKLELRVSLGILPAYFDRLETFVAPPFYRPLIKNAIAMQFKQRRDRILQEVKRQWLLRIFQDYEKQYEQYHQQYQQRLQILQVNCSTHLYQSYMAYIEHHIQRLQEEFFHQTLRLDRKKFQRQFRERSKQAKRSVGASPTVMINVFRHPFTTNEMAHLSRGPSYIRPNQSIFQSKKKRLYSIETTIKKYMQTLKDHMSHCKDRPVIPSTATIYKTYMERLRTQLLHYYFIPIPLMDHLRAQRELNYVKSIRRKLRKYRLILRETDKSSIIHISRRQDYRDKAKKYYEETGAYEELSSNPYDATFMSVVQSINRLRSMNKIKESQKEKILPIRDQVQLAYMYFLPKAHKIETPLRPIVNTIHAATTRISKFLDRLIRPLFDRYARETTIIDGVDLLHRLQSYVAKGYLTASTLFVTFDITNLYTMLPQEESLVILGEFLREYHCNSIEGISIETIIELARLVLQHNTFIFEKKFYRQIIGGAMGSPFTLTLANIFMWKWQKKAILLNIPSYEFYGRYIDDVFFTWNGSEPQVKSLLDKANQHHSHIKLEYQIGQRLPFLDVLLNNDHGSLISSVYHKPSTEPAILSFLSDHPRYVFRNIIQTFLMRAIRYSSTYELFNQEKRRIRLLLLYNRYPSTYINAQFRRFFDKYLSNDPSLFLPSMINEEQFNNLRQIFSTSRYSDQDRSSVSTISTTTAERSGSQLQRTMFVHCTHEARFFGLGRDIHVIHDSLFKNTPNEDIRLIVGHRNQSNLEFELADKRPRPPSILYDPLRTRDTSNRQTTSSISVL